MLPLLTTRLLNQASPSDLSHTISSIQHSKATIPTSYASASMGHEVIIPNPPLPYPQPPLGLNHSSSRLKRVLSRFGLCSSPRSLQRSASLSLHRRRHYSSSACSLLSPVGSSRLVWDHRGDPPCQDHLESVRDDAGFQNYTSRKLPFESLDLEITATPLPVCRALQEAEHEWRIEIDGLSEDARISLLGARCLKIFDPLAGFAPSSLYLDAFNQDDPTPDFPGTVYRVPRGHRSVERIEERAYQDAFDKPNEPLAFSAGLHRRATPAKTRQMLDRPRPIKRRRRVASMAATEFHDELKLEQQLKRMAAYVIRDQSRQCTRPERRCQNLRGERDCAENSDFGNAEHPPPPSPSCGLSRPPGTVTIESQYAVPPLSADHRYADRHETRRWHSDTAPDNPSGGRLQRLTRNGHCVKSYYIPLRDE